MSNGGGQIYKKSDVSVGIEFLAQNVAGATKRVPLEDVYLPHSGESLRFPLWADMSLMHYCGTLFSEYLIIGGWKVKSVSLLNMISYPYLSIGTLFLSRNVPEMSAYLA